MVQDVREKEVEAIEEARRLRSTINNFIREKPFDFDPSWVDFRIQIKTPNISVMVQGSPHSPIPPEFPVDIMWIESDEDDDIDDIETWR